MYVFILSKEDDLPIYKYQCMECAEIDLRVGGFNDQAAICLQCGSLMLSDVTFGCGYSQTFVGE